MYSYNDFNELSLIKMPNFKTAFDLLEHCRKVGNTSEIKKLADIVTKCEKAIENFSPLSSPNIKKLLSDFEKQFPDTAVVAGSAALHSYLYSNQKWPSWSPNDIDIWIPIKGMTPLLSGIYINRNDLRSSNMLELILEDPIIKDFKQKKNAIEKFFIRNTNHYYYGQHISGNLHRHVMKTTNYPINHIISVTTYNIEGIKYKIQLIYVTEMPKNDIVNTFDIDCLKVSYDLTTEQYVLNKNIKELIDRKEMFLNESDICVHTTTERFDGRVKKYMERGFKTNIFGKTEVTNEESKSNEDDSDEYDDSMDYTRR